MYPWDILPDFGVTLVINLARLTCSRVARLVIAEVLISQKRENSLCFPKSFSAGSYACCVLRERDTMEDYSLARLYPDFCNNNKVSSTSGDHLLCPLK